MLNLTKPSLLAVFLGATVALADYPPPVAKCAVPPICKTCVSSDGAQCGEQAKDAGLILSECFDFEGTTSGPYPRTEYYCPKGVTVHRAPSCGCTSFGAAAAMVMALVPLVPLLRRRRPARLATTPSPGSPSGPRHA